jgi:hypothetical protein
MNTNFMRRTGELVVTATGLATEIGHSFAMLEHAEVVGSNPVSRF